MIWFRLAWRNLFRNRRRSILELLAIAGSIFFAVVFQNMASGSYQKMIDEGTRMGSGHIGIYHEDYLAERKASLVFDAAPILGRLAAEPGVEAVYPRAYVPGLARSSRDGRPAVMLGVDFDKERHGNPVLAPKRFVAGGIPDTEGRAGGPVPAIIGAGLAKRLGVGEGKKLVFMGQDRNGQIQRQLVRVKGIVQTGVREVDNGMLIVPRDRLALFTGSPTAAHEIAVMVRDRAHIDAMVPALAAAAAADPHVTAFTWEQAMPEVADAIKLDSSSLQVTVWILFLLVGVGTINTLLMSVMERVREFGVIRALGVKRAGIRRMVLAEAVVLAIVGIGVGMALASLVNWYLATVGLDLSGVMGNTEVGGTLVEPVMRSIWDVPKMAGTVLAMFLIAVVASLYPAYRALKIRPSDAMRHY